MVKTYMKINPDEIDQPFFSVKAIKWNGINYSELKQLDGIKTDINDAAWQAGKAPPVVYVQVGDKEIPLRDGMYVLRGTNKDFAVVPSAVFEAAYVETNLNKGE
jgi:hypothetical protein